MLSKTHAAAADARAPMMSAFLATLPDHPGAPPPEADAFVGAFAADFRADELPGVSLADVARHAAQLWAFAKSVGSESTAIRVTPALAADGSELGAELVEIVQPDAPFLVDSVMAELIEAGASVLAMFHPLVKNGSGLRSMIQVWIEPLGEGQAEHIEAGLRATLADVRLAVADFDAMVALMGRCIGELKATAPAG